MRFIGTLLGFLLLFSPVFASESPIPDPQNYCVEPNYIAPPVVIPSALDKYLDKLALCESGNNPTAINPKDLDGTPSLGLFQFKTGTFNYFSDKYGISTTSIWNGGEQRKIVTQMAQDSSVDFHWQFPDCSRILGLPPKEKT